MTREEWLQQAIDMFRPYFYNLNHQVPANISVSIGFPGGSKRGVRPLGSCWSTLSSEDKKTSHIFITPEINDPRIVLATLAHELVHAVDDCNSQHKGAFIRIAKSIGLMPKWTATTAGETLAVVITQMLEDLPKYPHVKLTPAKKEKKQGTRMIKVECIDDGYTVRMTRKWLDEMGAPQCPCGEVMSESQ